MDWGFIIILGLAIFGAALVAGGIVAYRTGTKGAIKAVAAAAVASGIVMWGVVLITTPVSYSGEGPSEPEIVLSDQ